MLEQGLWGSSGGCSALLWVLCAALQVTLAGYGFAFRYCPGGKHVAWREGSRTPHEGTVEFISLDSHKGTGGSGFVTRAGAAPVVVLPVVVLPADVAGTSAFQAFMCTRNWVPIWAVYSCLLMAAVLGLARSLSDCSRAVPAPSGALAAAGL